MIGKNSKRALKAALVFAAAGSTSGFQQLHSPQLHQSWGATIAAKQDSPTAVGQNWLAQQRQTPSTAARKTTVRKAASTAADGGEDRVLDTAAIAKYAAAVVAQMGILTGLFTGLDALSAATGLKLPFAANFFLFFMLALKSRIFNPLSNERPQKETREIQDAVQRKMPEWTPPGFIFPIVWILLIGPLRATSSAILVGSGASYASPAILALMLHLSIGDTWNTINNVERRYGTSVVGVAAVWISAAAAAFQYGQVDPLAGKLLSLPLVWLTIASSLIFRTWQINPSEATGEKDSFLPTKPAAQEGSTTKLVWFEGEAE
jgi:tryptophan-rich sensory protein